MKYWKLELFFDDGKSIKLKKRIGKGMFTQAFLGPKNKVWLLTNEQDAGDYGKEILSQIGYGSKHIPKIEQIGETESGSEYYMVYTMPLYSAPLKKSNSPKAWEQAKTLRACKEQAWKNLMDKYPVGGWGKQSAKNARRRLYEGNSMMWEIIGCAKKNKDVTKALIRALELMANEAANYGSSYTFEFPNRNLATDKKGNLVLLDVLFDMESVAKQQKAKMAKMRYNPHKEVSPYYMDQLGIV